VRAAATRGARAEPATQITAERPDRTIATTVRERRPIVLVELANYQPAFGNVAPALLDPRSPGSCCAPPLTEPSVAPMQPARLLEFCRGSSSQPLAVERVPVHVEERRTMALPGHRFGLRAA